MPPNQDYYPVSTIWSKVVVSLAGAVCAIFVLLTYFKVIKRHCLSSRGAPFMSRLRSPMTLLGENTQDESSSQQQSRGLASAVIHSLPAIQFRGDTGDGDCAVCLGEYREGEWLRLLPNCAHVFHVACIDTWFRSHSTCPMCRTNVLYDFSSCSSSVSMVAPLETLEREDINHERLLGYRLLASQGMRRMSGDRIISDSDESLVGMESPIPAAVENSHTTETQRRTVQSIKEESSSRDLETGFYNVQSFAEVPD